MKEDFNRVVVFDFSKMTEADVEKAKALISQVIPVMPGFNEVFEKGFKKKEIVLDDVIATLDEHGMSDVVDNLIDNEKKELNSLTEDEMLIYKYYVLHKLSQSEIAKLMNTSQSTISRKIKNLKKKYKK